MPSILRAIADFVTEKMSNATARTTTYAGTALDTLNYEGTGRVIIHVGAVSGTSPTLDLKITTSATSGGTYTDVTGATAAQITAANTVVSIDVDLDNCKRYIKVEGTIGGTSPSFTIDDCFTGVKKY